jgi:hypothetical protein
MILDLLILVTLVWQPVPKGTRGLRITAERHRGSEAPRHGESMAFLGVSVPLCVMFLYLQAVARSITAC